MNVPSKITWTVSLGLCFVIHLAGQPRSTIPDKPFDQIYSIQYLVEKDGHPDLPKTEIPKKVLCDRNGSIQVLFGEAMWKPTAGMLLHPGKLVADVSYLPLSRTKVQDFFKKEGQFIYVNTESLWSNAWAGALRLDHGLGGKVQAVAGRDSFFLICNSEKCRIFSGPKKIWEKPQSEMPQQLQYDSLTDAFYILAQNALQAISLHDLLTRQLFSSTGGLTCMALDPSGRLLVLGGAKGYRILDRVTGRIQEDLDSLIPCTDLKVIRFIGGQCWFGSSRGAWKGFRGKGLEYYSSRRWLPSESVQDIAEGPQGSILILTDKGLSEIKTSPMNLYTKALFFENQVRSRHLRHGFNATLSRMQGGDPQTGILEDSDNDGLWTSMYLAGEAFRYAVTREPEALDNCKESLLAMERLFTLSGAPGIPARSFERKGYELHDLEAWRPSPKDSAWHWKSTTSSDEAIGHMFVYGVLAELVDDPWVRSKATALMDQLMQHILDHNLYMIDWNGKPTLWGKWNPEYVNAFPLTVGDRKLNSSNIISMLQTAYHFTHKASYRDKALELLFRYGYLENLTRPMKSIGKAPENADEHSKSLTDAWNHSDDEMYFIGYWGLYRYALNDSLKTAYREAIVDHWLAEKPEEEVAWNIMASLVSEKQTDPPGAVRYLQQYPLDLVNWTVQNSARRDLIRMADNFRGQTLTHVLPPAELPINRHNANLFELDGGDDGFSEFSAGDIWLFPYWMARYLDLLGPGTRMAF